MCHQTKCKIYQTAMNKPEWRYKRRRQDKLEMRHRSESAVLRTF